VPSARRPEDDVDAEEWPASGPWSAVIGGVPVLFMPALSLRSWFGLAATGRKTCAIGRGGLRLAIWLQARHSPDGPDSGSLGVFPWRHEGLDDMLDHYCHCHKALNRLTGRMESLSRETAYRDLKQLRRAGIVEQVRKPTHGESAVYRMVLRGDSPLIGRLPDELARTLRIAELAKLMSEKHVPNYAMPGPGVGDVADAYVSTVELEGRTPEQVREISALEVVALHARSPEQQDAVQRRVEQLEHQWGDQDGNPVSEPPAKALRGLLSGLDAEWTPAPKNGSLARSIRPIALVKRVLSRGCHTTPITASVSSTYGLFSYVLGNSGTQEPHGKAKSKNAPTARNTEGREAGRATEEGPDLRKSKTRAGRATLLWERYGPCDAEREAADQLRTQVWAMIRSRRPRQALMGEWVESEAGLSEFVPDEAAWGDFGALIGLVMVRTDAEFVRDQVAASATDTARHPVKVLCRRLWGFVDSLAPIRDVLAEVDLSPAEHVDESDLGLSPLVQGDLHRQRVAEISGWNPEIHPVPVESAGFRQALAALQANLDKRDRQRQAALAEVARSRQLMHERYGWPLEPISELRIQAPAEPDPEPSAYEKAVLSETERRVAEEARYGAARARARREKRAVQLLASGWTPTDDEPEPASAAELPPADTAAAMPEPVLQQPSPAAAETDSEATLAERLAARCLGNRRDQAAPLPAERPEVALTPRSGSTVTYHHATPPPDRLQPIGGVEALAELRSRQPGHASG
jgi:hypothetical protein